MEAPFALGLVRVYTKRRKEVRGAVHSTNAEFVARVSTSAHLHSIRSDGVCAGQDSIALSQIL
jgi:hypothetical protein